MMAVITSKEPPPQHTQPPRSPPHLPVCSDKQRSRPPSPTPADPFASPGCTSPVQPGPPPTSPSAVTSRFSGLRSLCTMPRLCSLEVA
jgi:hypothetical protein